MNQKETARNAAKGLREQEETMTYTDISVAGRTATRTITAAELIEADRLATENGDAGMVRGLRASYARVADESNAPAIRRINFTNVCDILGISR